MTLRRILLAAAIAIPLGIFAAGRLIEAERFSESIRMGVERALNRQVQFGKVSYSLLNGQVSRFRRW